MLETLWDILFPTRCLGCATFLDRGAVLCAACFDRIPRHPTLFCAVCLARLPDGKKICHVDAPARFGAAVDYGNDAVRALIHTMKFESARRAAEPLADLLIAYARDLRIVPFDAVVVPIPLGKRRENIRGFNQAHLIAERFAAAFALPCRLNTLVRTRETDPQSGTVGSSARHGNVAGCFTVADPNLVRGRHIILIDDVRTSGATLEAAAQALKAVGAGPRLALAVAKA